MHKYRFLIILFYLLFPLLLQAQSIHELAKNGDLEKLKSALKSGIDIDTQNSKGKTALLECIYADQVQSALLLLSNHANPNISDNGGSTPLYYAAHRNNTPLLELLLSHNADPNISNKLGVSPIHVAILNDNFIGTQKLVEAGAKLNIESYRKNTPLDLAVREGYSEIAKYLKKQGAKKSKSACKYDGPYIDKDLPGSQPKMFAYNFISTENKTQNAIFHPNGKEYYYTVETINNPGIIRVSKFINNEWTKPIPAPIPGEDREVDPFITSDEKKLFFCWDKPLSPEDSLSKNMDIWFMNREGDGWSAPMHLGDEINTKEHDWFPTVSNKGTLFYSTGKFPKSNICYAEFIDGKYQKAIFMDSAINTEYRDFAPFIAPDERFVIFSSTRPGGIGSSDLYISFKTENGTWTKAKNMGDKINSEKADFGPSLSTDGKYLFFTSWRAGTSDVFWLDAKVIENLNEM